MNKAEIYTITAITATIFGSLATATISVYGTKFEALTGLYTVFALAALALVVACLFTGIEEDQRFFSVNRCFVFITAVVFTAIPYLLWSYRIIYIS